MHEAAVWPFWEQSYKLVPDACWKFAISEWDHQINDQSTGDFSRHARYSRHETYSGFDFPRYAGQMMERWAYAYQQTGYNSQPRREELRTAIKVLFERMVENSKLSKSGYLIAGRSPKGDHINVVWMTSNLELALCLEEAAPVIPVEIAEQMRAFAAKQDDDFLNAPHRLDSSAGGFAVTLHAQTGQPRVRSMNKPYTSTWSSGYGYSTHAGVANTCFNRYVKLADSQPKKASKYKGLLLITAEKYLTSIPDTTQLLKPAEYAHVIELMLNSYVLTMEKKYLHRADLFAKQGMSLFLEDRNCLPKATNQHGHYESITGGPDFMHQLLLLHLAMQK